MISYCFFFLCRSVPLSHSIEQALVEGLWIVLKNISLPFHSSLIPILESGLYWQKTDKSKLYMHS